MEGLDKPASFRFVPKDAERRIKELSDALKQCKEKRDQETFEKLYPEYKELNQALANRAFFNWLITGTQPHPEPTFADIMLEAAETLDKKDKSKK